MHLGIMHPCSSFISALHLYLITFGFAIENHQKIAPRLDLFSLLVLEFDPLTDYLPIGAFIPESPPHHAVPPRKDTTGDDLPPTVSDQLSQLIIATNSSSSHTAAQLTALIETTNNLATQITKLTDNITTDSFRNGTPKSTDDSSSSNNRRPTPKPPKINLPLFDGSNPLGWIFQAENYFSYYKVPPEERIELTAFHLVGDALSWYQNLAHNDLLGTWPTFKRDLELRFGPSTYENHKATLFKLQQTASVSEYQTEFERVSNRVTGLSREALRDCYISGLRADIQNELALHKPASLHAACALSRLIEDKLNPNPKPKTFSYNKPTYTSWAPSSSSSSTITSPPQSNPKPSPPLLPTPMKSSSSLPVTRLSLEAIAQRRKDGLCFRCPVLSATPRAINARLRSSFLSSTPTTPTPILPRRNQHQPPINHTLR
ncbi:putative retrotransposon gag domain-containing protein [Helianthus annuus]|nr:putative retrotransposon gag domain-containing protein [Helianthus annuus]